MTFAGVYMLGVGALMVVQWAYFLTIARKDHPGVEEEAMNLRFHLVAEGLCAGALIAGGLGVLADASWGVSVSLVALGMLIYTVINSPGYFAQRREWRMVGMFAVLLVLAVISLIAIWP